MKYENYYWMKLNKVQKLASKIKMEIMFYKNALKRCRSKIFNLFMK